MSTIDTTTSQLVINRPTKTQFEQLTPNKYELWAVDPEFAGGKILQTDSNGDIIETSLSASGVVTDVQTSGGTSVVTSGVATLPASTVVTVRRFT